MDAHQILTASALDIIFDGRNKEYGAYSLRANYNKRLWIAMSSTALLVIITVIIAGFKKPDQQTENKTTEYILESFKQPEPKEEFIPPKPPATPAPAIKSLSFTSPPRIIIDRDVRKEYMPPEDEFLQQARIGLVTQNGISDEEMRPSQQTSNGITGSVETIRANEDSIYIDVQIQSEYPGGPSGWRRFLMRTLQYPVIAQEKNIEGAVEVVFMVDAEGSVTGIKVVSGPNELQKEAERVIKKSGKWTPAIQNGRKVKSYKRQSIIFRTEE